METLKFLLSSLFKIAIVLIIASVLISVVSNFYPTFTFKNIFSSVTSSSSESWLPAPGSFGKLFSTPKTPSATDNVFSYGNGFNNSQVDYVTYSEDGMRIIHTSGSNVDKNMIYGDASSGGYAKKSSYIRNLSIYEGGHIYTGISFYGEAKNTMFQNGVFPIIIADSWGRVISVTNAQATSNWSVPGWTRFYVKINAVLPDKIPCTMIFQSAESYTGSQPTRVAIPILCN